MSKIATFIIMAVLGASTGYFNAYNYVVSRSPHWIGLKESRERNSELLETLSIIIKETDWCEVAATPSPDSTDRGRPWN